MRKRFALGYARPAKLALCSATEARVKARQPDRGGPTILLRPVAPDAGLPAPRGGCGFDVGLVGHALGQLSPALAEEPLRHVGVADPAHGFRRPCGGDEAATDGLSFKQPSHGNERALASRPADTFWRADAVAADQLYAVEVEVVSVGPDRAAGLDQRALEENCISLE